MCRNRPPLRLPAPDGFAPVPPRRALARPFNAAGTRARIPATVRPLAAPVYPATVRRRSLPMIPATVCRAACQRFREHRNAAGSVRPVSGSEVPASRAASLSGDRPRRRNAAQPFDRPATVANIERRNRWPEVRRACQRFDRAAGFRRTSNAGKPSGFRSNAATVCRFRPVSGQAVANIGTPPDSPQPLAASRFR